MKNSGVHVKLDPIGIRVLLKSDIVKDELMDRADELERRLDSPAWESKLHMRASRATALVYSDSEEEKWREVATGDVAKETREMFSGAIVAKRMKPKKKRSQTVRRKRRTKEEIAADKKKKAIERKRKEKARVKKKKVLEKTKVKNRKAREKARNSKAKAKAKATKAKNKAKVAKAKAANKRKK